MTNAAKRLHTIEDWLSLPEDARAELIEGDIVYKVGAGADHGFAQGAIREGLGPFHRKSGNGGGPGGWWLMTEAPVIYSGRPNGFIHDLAGWRRERHSERPSGKRIEMKPDWVCEILSTNRFHDLTTKKWVMHEHRVEYIWMVDTDRQNLSVLKWSEKGYIELADVAPGQRVRLEPFEQIELSVRQLFGQDDEG